MPTLKVRYISILVILLMIAVIVPISASAQEDNYKKTIGITASLQGGETSVMFPIWVSERLVLTPAISYISISNTETELGFGIGPRINLKEGKAVPYLGLRFGVIHLDIDNGEGTDDFFLSGILGGEYFLANQFSVGVEMQVNLTFSDKYSFRFGNPDGTNFNTASAVAATFYF